MALADTKLELDKDGKITGTIKGQSVKVTESAYAPSDLAKTRISMVRDDFMSGYNLMSRPRREFNDMTLIQRTAADQMAWSVYQPNDGDYAESESDAWRSNAIRPIVRNKVFSIAAHIAAHTLFPKLVAFDKDSMEQQDAAQIMSDLMEWSMTGNNSAFADVSLHAVIAALVNPVSYVWTEYNQAYRTVKRGKKDDGTYETEVILDEDLSGFRDESIQPDQIYIQDFYQPDIQKQGWVIRRRIRPFTLLRSLYGGKDDFKYVNPGIQVLYNDANQQFYQAYDPELAGDEGEEVIYLNRSLDLRLTLVNGVLLSNPDEPNPREDKLYPIVSFGYELLRPNGDCAYYKSLAFKTMPDDRIVNTLYPLIIDGTYLAIMPPMVNIGGEVIASDVIAPGAVTTFTDPNADLKPLAVQGENLKAGMDALFKVEENISEDAFQPLQQGDMPQGGGNMPAYNMSQMEKNANVMMGPFLEMVGRYVKQMGRLRIGDIKQYMTLIDVEKIEGSANEDLIYRTFFLPAGKSRSKGKKIKFTSDMPNEPITEQDHLGHSYSLLAEEDRAGHNIAHANPELFRNLNYTCLVGKDVLAPMSEELEASWNLQVYDRMVEAPTLYDPQETAKLLLETSPTTRKHPDKYIAQQPAMPQAQGPLQQAAVQKTQGAGPMSTPQAPAAMAMGTK